MDQDRKTATGDRLAAAAVQVFEARGFHAARVSDIAAAAGVAKGTFYLYFASKEAIFHHLIDDFFHRLIGATLARYPADAVADRQALSRQLGEMWVSILTSCRQEPALTALVLRESLALGGDARAQVERHFTAIADAVTGYFDDLSARGLVRGGIGAASAWAILGLIERAVHYAVTVAPEREIATLAQEFLALELTGLVGIGPDPAG
tara:strand:+ start:517 stop:1137 length:621 start_codon:yes stop_codon:yes gene_type:complete